MKGRGGRPGGQTSIKDAIEVIETGDHVKVDADNGLLEITKENV